MVISGSKLFIFSHIHYLLPGSSKVGEPSQYLSRAVADRPGRAKLVFQGTNHQRPKYPPYLIHLYRQLNSAHHRAYAAAALGLCTAAAASPVGAHRALVGLGAAEGRVSEPSQKDYMPAPYPVSPDQP